MTNKLSNSIFAKEIAEIIPQTIAWYKHLHQYPELSFKEINTSNFIYEEIKKIANVDKVTRPTKTSVMAKIIGKKPGKTIALRADIDALPIFEETDINFKSKNDGVMHACGHDAHTSMLLSTLKIIASKKDDLCGEIRFLFQHAEEVPPGGAIDMLKAGVLDGVDNIFAFHIDPTSECGTFAYKEGIFCAASHIFEIKIKGRGVHASMPHLAIDPIVIGSQVVTNLQTIVSRNIDPLKSPVLSITSFQAGMAYNVIPETAILLGTLRTLHPKTKEISKENIYRIVENITKAHGADYEINWLDGYAVGHNDVDATRDFVKAAVEVVGEENIKEIKNPIFGAEDFTIFQQKVKGSMITVGVADVKDKTRYPLHHPKLKVNLDSLQYGIAGFLHLIKNICMK